MSDSTLVSLVVPVYNTGDHLSYCLDSLCGQTHRNLEIILVDDGSTDGSSEICDEYAARDKRVRCIHQENQGVSTARNTGIELANGDWILFPDSDDYLETDTVEYALAIVAREAVDIVAFEYYVTYPDREVAHRMPTGNYGRKTAREAHRVVCESSPFAYNKLFKRSLLHAIRFREDIKRGEDSLFVHDALEELAKIDCSAWFDERPLYHYVQSEESACRGVFRPSQLTALKLYEAYDPLCSKYPELRQIHVRNMAHLCTSIYYDMWSDAKDYSKSQIQVKLAFDELYPQALDAAPSQSVRIKFRLFRLSPALFCQLHRRMHRL